METFQFGEFNIMTSVDIKYHDIESVFILDGLS